MGVITAIRQNKHNKDRCSVFVDEEFLAACPIDVALALELKKGMEMTSKLEQELRRQDHIIVLKQKAYRYATYKSRTSKQVRDALIRYGASDEEQESVLEWLSEFRLIDDLAFAESFVEASIERKPLSARDTKRRLLLKGVPSDITDSVIEKSIDEDVEIHAAERVAVKKAASLRGSSEEKKQKLIRFLQYRQYSWSVIKKVLEKLPEGLLALLAVALLSQTSTAQLNECEKERLPESVNSFQPTTLPVMGPDGKLYVDRKLHPDNLDGITDPDDVWVIERRSALAWSEPKHEQFTTFGAPDILFNFTFDGLYALIAGKYGANGAEAFAIASRNNIKKPFDDLEVINIPDLPPLTSNFYGFLTNDRRTIIVAVDRPNGYGDLDLYVSTRCDGGWSYLKPLGREINTPGFEGAPWFADDGRLLYFASSGRNDRRGKADLYVSTRVGTEWDVWTEPMPLGDCINTPEDETAISLIGRGDTVLFTSWDKVHSRAGIYTALLRDDLRPGPSCHLILDVVDQSSKSSILNATATAVPNRKEMCDVPMRWTSDSDGNVHIPLPPGSTYTVTTSAPGYTSHEQQVTVGVMDSSVVLRVNVELYQSDIPIISVFFEKGSSDLTASERTRLDSALAVYDLKKLGFSVSGYTDGVGSADLNADLSQRRAAIVREALLGYGIAEERIEARGKGIERQATLGVDEPERRRVDIYPETFKAER